MLKSSAEQFSVGSYLEHRAQSPNFVAVEFGHRDQPIALAPGADFSGDRAYIGIEANMRSSLEETQAIVEEDIAAAGIADSNIFFINHEVGGPLARQNFISGPGDTGRYDSRTILPDGVADEVFAGNVLCDPLVGGYKDRTHNFLAELARVSAPGELGCIVLRETITPHVVSFLGHTIQEQELHVLATVRPDSAVWGELERVYDPFYDPLPISDVLPDSYYMFLRKQAS